MLISSALRNEYLMHKQRYRSYGQRPTEYRRFNIRFYRKGKTRKGGKFKQRGAPTYFKGKSGRSGKSGKPRPTFFYEGAWSPYEKHYDYEESNDAYFGGKGGKRKGNPKSPDGRVMECHQCGSQEHLKRECPKGKSGGKAQPQTAMYTNSPSMLSLGDMYNAPQAMPPHLFCVETEDARGSERDRGLSATGTLTDFHDIDYSKKTVVG